MLLLKRAFLAAIVCLAALPSLAHAEPSFDKTGVPHLLRNSTDTPLLGVQPGEWGLFLLDEKGNMIASFYRHANDEASNGLQDALADLDGKALVHVTGKVRDDGTVDVDSVNATLSADVGKLKKGAEVEVTKTARDAKLSNSDASSMKYQVDVDGKKTWIPEASIGIGQQFGSDIPANKLFGDKGTLSLQDQAADYVKDHPDAADSLALTAAKGRAAATPETGFSGLLERRTAEPSKDADKAK